MSILVTVVLAWFTVVKNVPNETEVSDMIRREAPYVEDRLYILESLKEFTEIKGEVQKIAVDVAEIKGRLPD